MRPPGAIVGLLLISATLAKLDHYDNHGNDLYLEDELDYGEHNSRPSAQKLKTIENNQNSAHHVDELKDSREFLEVKPTTGGKDHFGDKILAFRDALWDLWDKASEEGSLEQKDLPSFLRVKRQDGDTEDFEYSTDDPAGVRNVINPYNDKDLDDEDLGTGSGDGPRRKKEITLQVSFVVQEPYQEDYSNRDSIPFQNLSHSLADAVNALYDHLPGTQRATLVRIQSRPSDKFSCKVSMDLVTQVYYNLETLNQTLHDHIKNTRMLGNVVVSDEEFVFERNDVLEGEACTDQEFRCSSGQCVPKNANCNGKTECFDGSDEYGCEDEPFYQGQDYEEVPSTTVADTKSEFTEPPPVVTNPPTTTPPTPPTPLPTTPTTPSTTEAVLIDCEPNFLNCDRTRCVPRSQVCDGIQQCQDGADELDCIGEYIPSSSL